MRDEEELNDGNREMKGMIEEEQFKHDELKSQRMELEEVLTMKGKQIAEDSAYNKETEIQIAKLQAEVDKAEQEVNLKEAALREENVVNKTESKRNYELKQIDAALRSKLSFIEKNYDYSSNINTMSVDLFNQVMRGNSELNGQMGGFVEKLAETKKTIQKLEIDKKSLR